MIPQEYILPVIISNLVAIVLILTAIKWPRATRWIFSLIFLPAGIFNAYTALTDPQVYVEGYAQLAIPLYHDFILGFFSQHTTLIVLAIASGQLLAGLFLALQRPFFDLGVIGGIVFLLAIAPLGVGSAFPATLLMAAGLLVLHQRLRIWQQ